MIPVKIERNGSPVVKNDKIWIGGIDISACVSAYTVRARVGEIRRVELELLSTDPGSNLGVDEGDSEVILDIAGRRFRVVELLPEE